eukprot:6467528-Alexandrium_andersonii.AAC.1
MPACIMYTEKLRALGRAQRHPSDGSRRHPCGAQATETGSAHARCSGQSLTGGAWLREQS